MFWAMWSLNVRLPRLRICDTGIWRVTNWFIIIIIIILLWPGYRHRNDKSNSPSAGQKTEIKGDGKSKENNMEKEVIAENWKDKIS